MCGIAGAVNFNLSNNIINATMRHRGPDDQGDYTSGNVNFFHLRLAILDIGGGKQPMFLDNLTIVFNGEIYNHQELRQQFNLEGKTSSDTETLLMLYQRLGTGFLNHLDGMFAFAIHDKEKNTVFIARDRAGKKPLYYYRDAEKIVFASELNCLKGLLPLQVEEENFYHYLRLGTFYREFTPYKNVSELEAGNFLVIDCGTLQVQKTRWWNIHEFYSAQNNDTFDTAIAKVDGYLHTAVKRRLESSDLEVGCFLSGGIDSGIATAIASEYNHSLKTFTVSFNGGYDEAPLARLVAEKYNTNHTQIELSFSELASDLENILGNYGEPFFDSSAIPSYYVSREAKKHLTVIINGDGADELFGGYRRYVPFSKYDFFRKNILVKSGASFIKKMLPPPHEKISKYNYLYRLASLASKSHLEIYLSAGVDIFEDFENQIITNRDYLAPIKKDFDRIATGRLSGLKKIMNMDFDTNLPGDLLVKMDIATMANSLEGRSPFLSKELLEYVPGLQDSYKINGGTTKFLLRGLAKKYLPEQLLHQPKRGFEVPLKNWVNGQLKTLIHDYINSSNAMNRKFIRQEFVNGLLDDKIKIPQEKRAKILWTLFSMEVWYKKVYLSN